MKKTMKRKETREEVAAKWLNGATFHPMTTRTYLQLEAKDMLRELDAAERHDLTRGFTKADMAYFKTLDAASKRKERKR